MTADHEKRTELVLALDALLDRGFLSGWRIDDDGTVTVSPSLTAREVHQLATALTNRGDHRNGDEYWRSLAQRLVDLDTILQRASGVLPADVGDRPWQLTLTYVDNTTDELWFVSDTDAWLQASVLMTKARAGVGRRGSVVDVDLSYHSTQ
jgi:hypothetical protein